MMVIIVSQYQVVLSFVAPVGNIHNQGILDQHVKMINVHRIEQGWEWDQVFIVITMVVTVIIVYHLNRDKNVLPATTV